MNAREKQQKQLTQKKLIALAALLLGNIAAIIFMVVRIMGATGPAAQSGSQSVAPPQWQGEGVYAVGSDIPAGEYLVRATGSLAYAQLASNSDGDLENILVSYDFASQVYIAAQEGQYLQTRGCEFALAQSVAPYTAENGSYADGMFLVGKDIAPGSYIAQANGETLQSFVEVAQNSTGSAESILVHQDLQAGQRASLEVFEGQYLWLAGSTLLANTQSTASAGNTTGASSANQ